MEEQRNETETPAVAATASAGRWWRLLRRRRTLWLALAVVVLVGGYALVACVAYTRAEAPYNTAQQFCEDVRAQGLDAAYALLASPTPGQVTATTFAREMRLNNTVDGGVSACAVSRPAPATTLGIAQTPATVHAALTVQRTQVYSGTLTLTQSSGSWRIAAIAPYTLGRPVAPLLVAQRYCAALQQGNYGQAYTYLGSQYRQSLGSAAAYAARLRAIFEGGSMQLQSCTVQLPSYAIAGETTATVNAAVALGVRSDGTSASATNTLLLTMQPESGVWQIVQQTLTP